MISCELSLLAYRSPNYLNKHFIKGFSKPRYHSSDIDAQCITTISDGVFYVAFRGSQSTKDWLADLDIGRSKMDLPTIKSGKRPKVHRGFLRQFRSLQELIINDILDYIIEYGSSGTIVFTGHSLGGALASLGALYFSLVYPKMVVSCYNFGSPRVGHTTFVKLFKKHVFDHTRFVNEDDPVTMIPLQLRFTHLPKVLYIDENRKISTTKKNKVKSFLSSLFKKDDNPLRDHGCDRYYRKLIQY